MATVTNLQTSGTTDNLSSYTTGVLNPTTGPLWLSFFANSGTDPTVSGLGLTWTLVRSQLIAAGNAQGWTYMGTGTPSSGQITVNFGAGKTTFHWSVAQIDGGDNTTPVVQSASDNTIAGSATPTVTLAALSSPTNPVLAYGAVSGAQPTWAAGTNFTLLGQSATGAPGVSAGGEHGVNDPTVDFTLSVAASWVILAVEIAEAAAPPDAPTNPAATALSASSIRVTWDDVADETGYRVERSPDGTGSWSDVSGNLAADTVLFDDTGLTASTQYFYRVFAFNAGGDSDPSTTVNATTDAAPSGGGNRMGGTGAIRKPPRR